MSKNEYQVVVYGYREDGESEIIITEDSIEKLKLNETSNDYGKAVYYFAPTTIQTQVTKGTKIKFSIDLSIIKKIVASNDVGYNMFGWSIAHTATKIVAGACMKGAFTTNKASGGAYIYNIDGTGEIFIAPPKPLLDEVFGFSVAIYENIVVVGSPGTDNALSQDVGAAYIYNLQGEMLHEMVNPTNIATDFFGWNVKINSKFIIVSSPGHDKGITTNVGALHFYTHTGQFIRTLTPSTGADNDAFGFSIDLTETHVAVSAIRAGYDAMLMYAGLAQPNEIVRKGSVLIYDLIDFKETTIITPNEIIAINGQNTNDVFGFDIALNSNKIVIGAPMKTYTNAEGYSVFMAGAMYVYNLDGTGMVEIEFPAFGGIPNTYDQLFEGMAGFSVAINDTTIAMGIPMATSTDTILTMPTGVGEVHLFNLDGSNKIQLTPPPEEFFGYTGKIGFTFFGTGLSLSNDKLLVGGWGANQVAKEISTEDFSGGIYIFG